MEIDRKELLEKIRGAKEGEQSAFNYLLDRYWNKVYGFQLKRTRDEYEAEDICIQTFSKAFNQIENFDERFSFSTWLITISKNLHVDLIRKKKASIRAKTTSENSVSAYRIPDETPSIEDRLITQQHLAQLLRDIKQLKPHYQEVINLRYFQEKSYKEIASDLNEPMNNVKVKLLRARKLLAEIIKNRKA